jgi:hypothetical protein
MSNNQTFPTPPKRKPEEFTPEEKEVRAKILVFLFDFRFFRKKKSFIESLEPGHFLKHLLGEALVVFSVGIYVSKKRRRRKSNQSCLKSVRFRAVQVGIPLVLGVSPRITKFAAISRKKEKNNFFQTPKA